MLLYKACHDIGLENVNEGVLTGFEPVQAACNRLNAAAESSHATFLRIWLRLPKKLLILNLFSFKRKKCKHRGDNP